MAAIVETVPSLSMLACKYKCSLTELLVRLVYFKSRFLPIPSIIFWVDHQVVWPCAIHKSIVHFIKPFYVLATSQIYIFSLNVNNKTTRASIEYRYIWSEFGVCPRFSTKWPLKVCHSFTSIKHRFLEPGPEPHLKIRETVIIPEECYYHSVCSC